MSIIIHKGYSIIEKIFEGLTSQKSAKFSLYFKPWIQKWAPSRLEFYLKKTETHNIINLTDGAELKFFLVEIYFLH
jgi:hypothetical protein